VPDTSALLVVQHQDDCPPARFADWLGEAGVRLDVRRPDRGDALPGDLAGHAGLVVLGGTMGAHDDAEHPWLPLTKALLRHAVAVEAPTLGICLGHQLAAVALGGTSAPNAGGQTAGVRRIGWLDDDATGDPLFAPLAETDARVVHWNSDVVAELPDGVAVLARTDDEAPQVLRFGPRSWGVQFHPEVDHAGLVAWAEQDRAKPADARVDLDEALQEAKEWEAGLFDTGRLLARTFADVVAGLR
jgi:GMP synthase (glutamine-hydrolysing)